MTTVCIVAFQGTLLHVHKHHMTVFKLKNLYLLQFLFLVDFSEMIAHDK